MKMYYKKKKTQKNYLPNKLNKIMCTLIHCDTSIFLNLSICYNINYYFYN